GSSGISISALNIVNDKLVFTANDGTNGSRLWSSDGTAAGTKMISPTMNVYNIIGAGSTIMNNSIYFPGTSGGTQLWKSDGTETGTVKVADIASVTGGSGINIPVTVGNNIFFKVGTKELWKSDGTASGTVLVKNMEPVSNGGTFSPLYMLAYDNNTLMFTCNYTNSWETNPWGCELWKSDGTDAGTSLVKSFNNLNGSTGITPNTFTKYNGQYYFMAYSTSGYYELWKTNTTPAGTSIVRSSSQLDGSFPEAITVANGLIYYIGWGATSSNNYGLWQSDGTAGGTIKITETGGGCTLKPGKLLLYPDKEIIFATAIENFTGNYYGEEPFVTPLPAKAACTQNNTPTISITSNAAGAACPGTSISFTATTTYAGTSPTYQWKKNGTNISWATGSTMSITSLANSDTISCVLTSNADCVTGNTGASNKIVASVYTAPTPTVSASGSLIFCQGGSVTLTSSVASSYLWSTGATTRSIVVNTAGNYTVTVTNSTGCKGASAVKTVTVNALPVATVSADGLTTFCQGGSVTLTASAASSYLWSNGATTQSIIANTAGNYSVTVTNVSGCSATSAATDVIVNPLPTPSITANGPTTFCTGGSVTLSSSAASYYTWYDAANQPVWYQQDYSATNAGSYHVTVGDANGCEGSSSATTVTTNPLPEPVITASGPITFCQGGSVTLTAPNGYSSYLWSNGATSKTITVSANGSYSVTVTNANGCSGISNQIFVFVNALPVPNVTANGPLSFCQGGNVKLTANNGYSSYLWSNGATTKAITVNTAGNYTVTVTDASTGCTGTSAVKTVTVNPLPIPTISANGSLTFCQGGSVTLTASAASTYLWSTGAKTQSITVNASGNYNVTVTNANGCSGASAITQVTVNPIPQPTINASGPTTFCNGGNVKLTASINGTYLWSNGATTKAITVTTAGNYTVTVTTNGCSGTSPVTKVIVNALPTVSVTASGPITNLCPGVTVTLTSTVANSYLWSNGATTRSILVNAAGSYSATVTNASGCSAISTITKVTYQTCPAPKGLKATVTSATAATLKWNTATCGISYQLQYRKVGAAAWTTITLTDTFYNTIALLPATAYQWQLATVCQNSPIILSAYTTGTNFTTPASSSVINAPVVFDELKVQESFSAIVFPNPAKNNAVLRLSGNENEVAIMITDISGKVLWKSLKVKDQQVNLPIEKFANGIYFLTVNTGKEIKMLKLVKE
ncbi:MAG TPA: T9SS type A sorting domain-containing protein, partial [Panacibacter sp.]|nr:T9SS type A sorting domain-containing protein [Panacibacter sp.]